MKNFVGYLFGDCLLLHRVGVTFLVMFSFIRYSPFLVFHHNSLIIFDTFDFNPITILKVLLDHYVLYCGVNIVSSEWFDLGWVLQLSFKHMIDLSTHNSNDVYHVWLILFVGDGLWYDWKVNCDTCHDMRLCSRLSLCLVCIVIMSLVL